MNIKINLDCATLLDVVCAALHRKNRMFSCECLTRNKGDIPSEQPLGMSFVLGSEDCVSCSRGHNSDIGGVLLVWEVDYTQWNTEDELPPEQAHYVWCIETIVDFPVRGSVTSSSIRDSLAWGAYVALRKEMKQWATASKAKGDVSIPCTDVSISNEKGETFAEFQIRGLNGKGKGYRLILVLRESYDFAQLPRDARMRERDAFAATIREFAEELTGYKDEEWINRI